MPTRQNASNEADQIRQMQQEAKKRRAKAISDKFEEARRVYFAADDDAKAQALLLELEELNNGPYEQTAKWIQKIENEKPKGIKISSEPVKEKWLSETLRRVFTKNLDSQHHAVVQEAQDRKDQLSAAEEAQKAASARVFQVERAQHAATAAQQQAEADATAAIESAGKKEKEKVQEEWDAKLADAASHLQRQGALLADAVEARDSSAREVADAEAQLADALRNEQAVSNDLQLAKDAANERYLAAEKRKKNNAAQQQSSLTRKARKTFRGPPRCSIVPASPRTKTDMELDEDEEALLFLRSPTNDRTRLGQVLYTIDSCYGNTPCLRTRPPSARPRSAFVRSNSGSTLSASPQSRRPKSAAVRAAR